MILQAKHLTKRYGNHTAVDDIQLQLSLIHISEPTRPVGPSRMPSSA